MGWHPEQDEVMKKLAGEGLSAKAIGERVGRTKNAVIGRAARQGVKLSQKNVGAKPGSNNSGGQKPRRKDGTYTRFKPAVKRTHAQRWATGGEIAVSEPKAPYVEPVTNDIGVKTLLQLGKHECRWPIGDPKKPGFLFCSAPVTDGRGNIAIEREPHYCIPHLRRACPTHADLPR